MKFKKVFLVTVLFFLAVAFADERTLYFARHGQRGSPACSIQLKNVKEDRLMPKGIEQAEALGKYMASIDFDGKVYVSPYFRTLETASIACKQFSKESMTVDPRIQEVVGLKDASGQRRITKKCITKSEIKKYFPNVIIPKNMEFPWRYENEKTVLVEERIHDFVEDMLNNSTQDVFVVCHGGLMNIIVKEMNSRGANFKRRTNFNCCLYAFTIDTQTGKVIRCSDETKKYLSDRLITDNLLEKLL